LKDWNNILKNNNPFFLETRNGEIFEMSWYSPTHFLRRVLTNGNYTKDFLEFLFFAGASDYSNDKDKGSALHLAVEHDRIDALEYLLKRGANINLLDEEGRTPLDLATALMKTQAIEKLQSHQEQNRRRPSIWDLEQML